MREEDRRLERRGLSSWEKSVILEEERHLRRRGPTSLEKKTDTLGEEDRHIGRRG